MKLIFALGNPGSKYAGTRHNVGFMAVDMLARERGSSFVEKPKFHAYIAELSFSEEKVLLVKPTTFYNDVGLSARSLIDFYKLSPADDLLVIYDDLALPFGTIRIRKKGSDAGNNGVKSLNAHIGAYYTRVRVGTASLERTNDNSSYVLSHFNSDEAAVLKKETIPKIYELINDFLTNRIQETSYTLI